MLSRTPVAGGFGLLATFRSLWHRAGSSSGERRRSAARFGGEVGGGKPADWPGWPAEASFAFVLTHDVHGAVGVERCQAVAEVEMKHGFRSSFHFSPDAAESVPERLLEWLREHGFEVAIRDRVDVLGQPRAPRGETSQWVESVNCRLQQWGAVGCRLEFRPCRLDWLQDLAIEYDCSAFDVDPSSPEAEGVGTVFPFWVPRRDLQADAFPPRATSRDGDAEGAEGGFVELPQTLASDGDLADELRRGSTGVWDGKLAWIARQGGMALLNTRPDRAALDGSPRGADEYPLAVYDAFLGRMRREHGGRMYHDLPRAVASYVRGFRPGQVRGPLEVGVVVFSSYEQDGRVRRYAESLARRGDRVTVFCIASANERLESSSLNGVTIRRICMPDRGKNSRFSYVFNYGRFWWQAFRHLTPAAFPAGCDLIHVHNMPEALVFATVLLRRRGTKIILDLHDLMPELYQDRFRLAPDHVIPRILRTVERWACEYSDHIIVANHLWKEVIARRSRLDSELTALANHVDLRVFHRRPRTRQDDRFVILYPGSLNYHQGLDLAIDAMAEVHRAVPKAELHIYGRGPELDRLKSQASRLGLDGVVQFFPPVAISTVADLMANADLGVVPKRADGFGNEAYSTKISEYMSQGLPVVVSRTKIDTFYFNDSVVSFFESGNSGDLARKIIAIARDPERRSRLSQSGLQLVESSSWDVMERIYLNLVDRLTRVRRAGTGAERTCPEGGGSRAADSKPVAV